MRFATIRLLYLDLLKSKVYVGNLITTGTDELYALLCERVLYKLIPMEAYSLFCRKHINDAIFYISYSKSYI